MHSIPWTVESRWTRPCSQMWSVFILCLFFYMYFIFILSINQYLLCFLNIQENKKQVTNMPININIKTLYFFQSVCKDIIWYMSEFANKYLVSKYYIHWKEGGGHWLIASIKIGLFRVVSVNTKKSFFYYQFTRTDCNNKQNAFDCGTWFFCLGLFLVFFLFVYIKLQQK